MQNFENDFAQIFYDKELDAIALHFKKQAPSNDFIKINQKVLEIFKTLKTNKFYVDTRKIGVVSVEGQKWVIENLFPGMIAHINGKTLFHVQLVNPDEIFGKVAVNNIKTKSATPQNKYLVIESFDSEQQAKHWLKTQ